MTVAHALEPATDPRIRKRGGEYFLRGAVVHFDPQATFVYAVVRGSDDYVVRLELGDGAVLGTCTCPFFNDHLEPCKHLWAVALTCDARGALQSPDTIPASDLDFVAVPLDDESNEDDWSLDDPEFRLPRPNAPRLNAGRLSDWRQALAAITATSQPAYAPPLMSSGHLLYVIDLAASNAAATLVVHLLAQERKQNGDWGVPKPARINSAQLAGQPEPDRLILGRLAGARPAHDWAWSAIGGDLPSVFHLRGVVVQDLLPTICSTGRCRLALTRVPTSRPQDAPLAELRFDAGAPFAGVLRVTRDDSARVYTVGAELVRADTTMALDEIHLLLDAGIAITRSGAVRLEPGGVMPWLHQLLARGTLHVPVSEAARLREALLLSGTSDATGLPEELRTGIVDTAPVPHLALRSPGPGARMLQSDLLFSYDGGPAQAASTAPLAPTRDPQTMARRRPDTERLAHDRLRDLGARTAWNSWERRQVVQVATTDVPRIVRLLVGEGWHVEVDGRRCRASGATPTLRVTSGLDWFELHGDVTFDDQRTTLPQLLAALRGRQGTVVLGDGTVGILPDEWLRDFAPFALGTSSDGHLRFKPSQLALLDALLAATPEVDWDQRAAAARDRLRTFDTIRPADPPPTFEGTLRSYQREALGWLVFLREFGFGGCLADDMGLGKTVVVLALLEGRRHQRQAAGQAPQPSLVVVPRSVLFNWQQEAARFAPQLKVLDFSGADRASRMDQIPHSDLVLVTYGTLRRDAAPLADVAFDYVVLDESQTIKNANTVGARSARLLKGEHRLALSGTPVENRLGDLWSLFEFLNPGLLSGATAFGHTFSGNSDGDELRLLGRGLRPFILRRTKAQVASELPSKTEQTIVCELERRQRALYNELRDHYRRTLLGKGETWQRAKLQVLEALLRLRQAACHPALVDPKRADDPSAKLDLLVPRLVETVEEGHKALVFSQFTSFLALLRTQLDARGLAYQYLDGRTRDRASRVEQFQNDDSCRLFLISLKAGGVGLNLTAADYVFILDPWWNPAAEAQAVDRAHRIGQTRSVFAYRLIARDTVEERVLELQQRKRELAEAIITADNSVIRSLQKEDLELLLS